uniref:Chromosome 5 open reading frame 34 n=1 Tax=Pelusios castaneus TaxID=367368 RepID=A0A8C8RA09_9SAUR
MKPESLMILYEDDSVEVHYIDGSRLLLAPCGSEFLFEKALPASAHPLQPAERIRQRTQFVISTYREQLLQALDFRNQYSTSLYLPSSIIPPERKNILFTNILEVRWPRPNATGAAIRMHNGSIKISSLDGHAYLSMSELQQEFTVEFLCKVSQKSAASSSFSEKNNKQNKGLCGKSSGSFTSEMFPKQMRMENKKDEHCWTTNKFRELNKSNEYLHQVARQDGASSSLTCCSSEYVWVTQHWSVSSYPEEWKYPLSLALMFYQLHTDNLRKRDAENECTGNRIEESDVLTESEQSKAVSDLLKALPLSCSAPHLHRWNFCDFFLQRKQDSEHNTCPLLIKIVWCQGIIYRLIHGNANFIEIYPGDGSVFMSEGEFLGNYFTRYSVHAETRQREEKMYSANSLPPDIPESPYSVCSIITQATRILQYCCKTKLSLTHNYRICCWRMVYGREMLPVLLHETVIPNVGRLVAYSDNKVQALFCDGMTLNMVWDFSSCCGNTQRNEGVTRGWCKLISPDGAQQLIKINHPGIYERLQTGPPPQPTLPCPPWLVLHLLEAGAALPSSASSQCFATPGLGLGLRCSLLSPWPVLHCSGAGASAVLPPCWLPFASSPLLVYCQKPCVGRFCYCLLFLAGNKICLHTAFRTTAALPPTPLALQTRGTIQGCKA